MRGDPASDEELISLVDRNRRVKETGPGRVSSSSGFRRPAPLGRPARPLPWNIPPTLVSGSGTVLIRSKGSIVLKTLTWGLLALTLLAVPAHVVAQDPVVDPEQQQVQDWLAELQQIQQRLAPLQARALEDPEIQASHQALEEMVRSALREEHPQFEEHIERIEALEQEAREAQQAGDEQRLQELAGEHQQIQAELMGMQAQVLERPEVAARVEQFDTALRSHMAELDPEAPAMLERYEELQARLSEALDG
jgi:DNA-binding transcriptional regulator YbjK